MTRERLRILWNPVVGYDEDRPVRLPFAVRWNLWLPKWTSHRMACGCSRRIWRRRPHSFAALPPCTKGHRDAYIANLRASRSDQS